MRHILRARDPAAISSLLNHLPEGAAIFLQLLRKMVPNNQNPLDVAKRTSEVHLPQDVAHCKFFPPSSGLTDWEPISLHHSHVSWPASWLTRLDRLWM